MSQNLNGRKVSTLRLHQTSQAEGFGTITTPLVSKKQGEAMKVLDMVICDKGVYCKGKGAKGPYEFLIPMHNIVTLDLVPEAEVVATKPVVK